MDIKAGNIIYEHRGTWGAAVLCRTFRYVLDISLVAEASIEAGLANKSQNRYDNIVSVGVHVKTGLICTMQKQGKGEMAGGAVLLGELPCRDICFCVYHLHNR
jgi:hypothetical protein